MADNGFQRVAVVANLQKRAVQKVKKQIPMPAEVQI
jgi:hypothetical protein